MDVPRLHSKGDIPTGECFYFGYGANMNSLSLAERGVQPTDSWPGTLTGYELCFDVYAPYPSLLEPCYCNVRPHSDGVVHGVVHQLSPEALRQLDRVEGDEYHRSLVTVRTYEGVEHSAFIYFMTPSYPAYITELPRLPNPSARYLSILANGARKAGLDAAYISWLQGQPSTPVPALTLTSEHLALIRGRQFTLAEVEASATVITASPDDRSSPLLCVLKGVVLDVGRFRPNFYRRFYGAKDCTIQTARRVPREDALIVTSADQFNAQQCTYTNGCLHDLIVHFGPPLGYTNFDSYTF